jgi:hypothetical protein
MSQMARKKPHPADTDATYWDHITLMVPWNFEQAAREAAHRYKMPVTEYCRRALLLRLEADGVRLEDYEAA